MRITRTRDAAIIASADIAFDVGEGKYDHHQKDGNGKRENGIPYAAFGLIWKDYGVDAIAAIYHSCETGYWYDVAAEVDRILVQQVDAADNGVALHDGTPTFDGVRGVSISSAIHWFNPAGGEGEDFDAAFAQAVDFAATVLRRTIAHAASAVDGRAIMARAVRQANDGRTVIVLERYIPDWQAHLVNTPAVYCVYPSAGTWRCQGVPVSIGSQSTKRPLPIAWGALNGAGLQDATGVSDATFCHRGLFICGAVSEAGAMALAIEALKD